jgi:hypothetical protein
MRDQGMRRAETVFELSDTLRELGEFDPQFRGGVPEQPGSGQDRRENESGWKHTGVPVRSSEFLRVDMSVYLTKG